MFCLQNLCLPSNIEKCFCFFLEVLCFDLTLGLFLNMVWIGVKAHFLKFVYRGSQHYIYWQDYLFLIRLSWHISWKPIASVNSGLFWTPQAIPLVFLFILTPRLHCPEYVALWRLWRLQIRKWKSSIFIFLFKNYLEILGPLHFHVSIRTTLPTSTKTFCDLHRVLSIYIPVWQRIDILMSFLIQGCGIFPSHCLLKFLL